MDTRLKYQNIIKDVMQRYASYPSPHADIQSRLALDDEHGSYAFLQAGWYGNEYLHGAIIHIDIIEEKIWIQYDGTEDGVALDLIRAGIAKEDIVLGFRPPEVRPYVELSV
jgi:hypothetical protein